ncbi:MULTISPECIES: hypothetical protein [unclassified Thiocapsa]|uniref:hypothetical protein n=1 Tax=unclassified Thiocapsa TaxID=2641286 RepID=UPI0035AEB01C
MAFLHVETGEIDEAEWDRRQSPYAQQAALMDLLTLAWSHNAAILIRYGYRLPDGDDLYPWAGTPPTQTIVEPDAIEAGRVIDAICGVWRAIQRKDVFAVANAAHWLGRMTGGGQYRQHQARNRMGKKGPGRSKYMPKAKEIYDTRQDWPDFKAFSAALNEANAEIKATVQDGTVRTWWNRFENERKGLAHSAEKATDRP